MTRQFYVGATASVASAFALSFAAIALTDPLPRVIWNASASAPLGLYRIRPDSDPPVGALVAVAPPERLGRWMAERGYLGRDVPLFRRHGIMRHWIESGLLDPRVRDGEKSRQLAAKLYDCIGRAMADFVTRGAPAAKAAAGSGR